MEILVAVKYVAAADIETLADAGVTLVGENRAQDLLEKVTQRARAPALAGTSASARCVAQGPRLIVLRTSGLIHSVASESVLRASSGATRLAGPRDPHRGKCQRRARQGRDRAERAGRRIRARSPVDGRGADDNAAVRSRVGGLSRPYFRARSRKPGARARPAGALDGHEPGTSRTAVEEGATIVRIGDDRQPQQTGRPALESATCRESALDQRNSTGWAPLRDFWHPARSCTSGWAGRRG